MRYDGLTDLPIRPLDAVLPENRPAYEKIIAEAQARLTLKGQEEMLTGIEKAVAEAAGEPGLLNQSRPNYVTNEAVVRSFVGEFGQVVLDGAENQVPEYTTASPDTLTVYSVAPTAGKGGSRRRSKYRVTESQTTGMWKEFQTEPVEIDFPNDFFARKYAMIQAQATDKLAYYARKELDTIAWTTVTNAIGAFTMANVYTFRDTDNAIVPTTNTYTSTKGFWPTLREKVLNHFLKADLAGGVINVHILASDLQYLFQVAGVGTQSLGQFTSHQEKVYRGNIFDIELYGYRFRIIPQNWKIASGTLYANVGPVYKMWLPPQGSKVLDRVRDDFSRVMSISRVYEILSPAPWFPRIMYSTWSTSDVTA